jgi:hypothetical protein
MGGLPNLRTDRPKNAPNIAAKVRGSSKCVLEALARAGGFMMMWTLVKPQDDEQKQ